VKTAASLTRVLVGLVVMALCAIFIGAALALLLPSRMLRIRVCQITGKAIAPFYVWLLGCRTTIVGQEHLDEGRPAIYVSNHTSPADIFIAGANTPYWAVSVAKKQILYYPFLGLLYLLSGHLWIDRSRSKHAKARMQRLGEFVKENRLSIFLWPEGTRSRDGRLRPFKRGFVHLALQTGLPVVPFVVQGAQRNWENSTLRIHPTDIRVDVLPAIDTSGWSLDDVEGAIEEVHAKFRCTLPAEQLGERP
jgi:lysophosphatidate acyltransferase